MGVSWKHFGMLAELATIVAPEVGKRSDVPRCRYRDRFELGKARPP